MNKNKISKKYLVAVHDPGGALATLPVIDGLMKKNVYHLSLFAGGKGSQIMSDNGFDAGSLSSNIDIESARQLLANEEADVLITGTSELSNAEQQLRNAAFEKGIASFVILDFWSNAALRWKESMYALSEIHDTVCIMDQSYKDYMIDQGFNEEALVVTGQPHLERLFHSYQKNRNLTNYASSFLYLSEPPLYEQNIYKGGHTLKTIIQAVNDYAQAKNRKCRLGIKPHPKEDITELRETLKEAKFGEFLKVEMIDAQRSMYDLINNHEIVLGNTTMGLFEARILNAQVISLNLIPMEAPLKQAMKESGITICDNNLDKCLADLKLSSNAEIFYNKHKDALTNVLSVVERSDITLKHQTGV